MLIKDEIYIPYLNSKRTLHIYFNKECDEPFNVLYMFDGHNLFSDNDATYGKSWGFKDYLDSHFHNLLIVGIECNHENNRRLYEYTPFNFNDRDNGFIRGEGKKFAEFIINDLKPYIDHKYNVNKSREATAIGGSSLGALMSLYTGLTYENTFGKIICISPFIYQMEKNIYRLIKNSRIYQQRIYLSWGDCETSLYHEDINRCSLINNKIAYELTKQGKIVYPHFIKNGEHCEASWEKEIPVFMNELEIK